MRNRWTAVFAVSAAILLTATGCSSSFFEPLADPVGTWSLTPDGGSTIVMRVNHTFTAESIPPSVACTHHVPADDNDVCDAGYPLNFSGTWTLDEENPIEVFFDNGDHLRMSGFRTGRTLGFWVGDPERPDPTYKYVHD